MLQNLQTIQLKAEQIIAIIVSIASALMGWYAAMNSKMSALETKLQVKENQIEYFIDDKKKMDVQLDKISTRQDKMAQDIQDIRIFLERKADRQ